MCAHCGCLAAATHGEPFQERERVLTLIGGVRGARRDGEVALMAALAREIVSALDARPRGPQPELYPALAEASGSFLADPGWPDRLVADLAVLHGHLLAGLDGADVLSRAGHGSA